MRYLAVSLAMFGFLLQHTACCELGCPAPETCEHSTATCCSHSAHNSHSEHRDTGFEAEQEDSPACHLCVGNHVFFLNTAGDISATELSPCPNTVIFSAAEHRALSLCGISTTDHSVTLLSTLPVRAQLQVFLL